jgi:hypothetical protein
MTMPPCLIQDAFTFAHVGGPGDPKAQFTSRVHRDSIDAGLVLPLETISDRRLGQVNALLRSLQYQEIQRDNRDRRYFSPPRATAATSPPVDTTADVFRVYVPARIARQSQSFAALRGRVRFDVLGDDTHELWCLDGGHVFTVAAPTDCDAECTFVVSRRDLLDIVNGRLNVGEACLQLKLVIYGDIGLGFQFARLLFSN